ncbi:MAG: glycosyltransferase family 9 protein, partial [Bryobacteraceae bacterium]|nr:glycosyltransferase family 9 protein [Bryobacteraceae bacterium]
VAPIPPARLFAERHSQTNPIAVIHPFASAPEKTWPAQNFLTVAQHLQSRQDLEPVYIAGPGEDLTAFSEFQTLAGASMSSVKSLLSGAALFLGNDSGPAHLAAAFGVPAIVFFGPSDSVVWAPWKVESRVLSANPISQIPVSEAIEAAAGLCGRVSAKEQC